jgi:hypothetical protein
MTQSVSLTPDALSGNRGPALHNPQSCCSADVLWPPREYSVVAILAASLPVGGLAPSAATSWISLKIASAPVAPLQGLI